MPIYEYRCDVCGHYLDALQKIADDPLRDCPACEKAALRRLVSAPNFRLKGKGWYETDFKSDKETKRNLVDHPEDSAATKGKGESAKSDDAKGDGKPGKGERVPGKDESASRTGDGRKPGKPSGKSGAGADSKPMPRSGRSSDSAAA